MSVLIRTFSGAALALALALPALAGGDDYDAANDEEGKGPVYYGFVRDHRGSPVPDARVVLQPKSGEALVLKSNVLGLYRSHVSKGVPPRRHRRLLRQERLQASEGRAPQSARLDRDEHRDQLHAAAAVDQSCCAGWRTGPACSLCSPDAAQAQPADTILLDGKIITFDSAPAEALAVRGDRIVAIGRSADIRALAGPATRVIDLAGRTVIPGLIDSHIHAIRAGLTFTTEVHWIGATSLAEALDRLRAAAQAAPKGSWLVVAGGWIESQFAERRRPTQAEIAAAAPDHHVYVQVLYSAVLLSAGGHRGARACERCRAGVAPEDRDRRRRQADRLDQRRQPQHQRPVRQAAAADASRSRSPARARSSARSTASASPACSIPAATTCRSRPTRRCSRCGAIAR